MRTAIQQTLASSIPEIGGRVLDQHSAGTDTTKPYLILRLGGDSEGSVWTGYRREVEIWPYEALTATFQDVDALADKVAAALDKKVLTASSGEIFTCSYTGSENYDYVDNDLGAITRGLNFAVFSHQPVVETETVSNDPWLEAISVWTEGLLGTGWQVYRNIWPSGFVYPSVLWRLAGSEIIERSGSFFEIRKNFAGHVAGSTTNEQVATVVNIFTELISAIKISAGGTGSRYLTVKKPVVDYNADYFIDGQIKVTMSMLTTRPEEEYTLMAAVHNTGIIE